MPLAGIVTLLGVGLVVAALAIYLIWVAALLSSVSSKLTTIIDRLWGISTTAEPLHGAISEINRDLVAARQSMDTLLQQPPPQPRQRASGGGAKAAGRKSGGRRSPRKAAPSQV